MTRRKDLSLFGMEPKELNPYEKHFLLKNPFPGHGEGKMEFDVCTDQEKIKKAFVYILRDFSTEAKRLRINGRTGAGKTNILEYFKWLTDEARQNKYINNLYPIYYVYTRGEDYFNIHEQIVDKLTGSFLTDLIIKLKSEPGLIETLPSEIKSASELLTMIKTIVEPVQMSYSPQEERQKDAFIRWLKGQKLTSVDKNLLTDAGTQPVDINSPSLAMRFLYGWIVVLKKLNLCDGIILLFDEFEVIFEVLNRSQQSRYAQDLRHLFDMLKESIFFVIATTPEPRDLAQYPAIERRLGDPVELQSIDDPELAIDYVTDYLNSGRDKFEADKKRPESNRPSGLEPLTREIVEEEYLSLKQEVEASGENVLPGYFLPRMRERMRQIVENGD